MACEICPECGAEKHQLMKCPKCGFQKNRRTRKPSYTIPMTPTGTDDDLNQRVNKGVARSQPTPATKKPKERNVRSYSKQELEAEIAKLERVLAGAAGTNLKQFGALRARLVALKREHTHRISGYRRRMVRFVSGGSPGLKR